MFFNDIFCKLKVKIQHKTEVTRVLHETDEWSDCINEGCDRERRRINVTYCLLRKSKGADVLQHQRENRTGALAKHTAGGCTHKLIAGEGSGLLTPGI